MSALLDEIRTRRLPPDPPLARAIRIAAGVTQQRLADELGVHWTTVARWERGERHPRPQLRAAYAALLNEITKVAGGDGRAA